MKDIVSVEWLNEHLNDQNLILLDASPQSTAEGKTSEYGPKTIPGARFFDLKGKFSDPSGQFPNTVPGSDQFEKECRKLGINKTSEIVVFDNLGIYSGPRVWWLFKAMGHEKVSVLNGGLPEWVHHHFPVVDRQTEEYSPGDFNAAFRKEYLVRYDDIRKNVEDPSFLIVDARSAGRFNGTEKEPRKHLKSGHIPHSVNIPYKDVLENGKMKSQQQLEVLFRSKCAPSDELVFSCGSGLTACIIMLACEVGFKQNRKLYDGSWTEWAELEGLKE